MPKLNGLSIKQLKFIDAYLGAANGNGTKAAQLAGYHGSLQTLKAVASENLTKPDIRKEMQNRIKTVMTGDEVLQELSNIATAECREPIRVSEKLKALELMGKHHKLLTDKVENDVELTPESLDRLGQNLIAALMDAATRMKAAHKAKLLAAEADHNGP